MSIWLILWLLLSGALLYFLIWTLFILYRQKKTWRAYARRKKLRYRSDSLLGPPELGGQVGDYTISLFTGEHMTADMRGTRKLTAFEIQLSSTMPVAGGLASGGMVKILQRLKLKEETTPTHPKWNKAYIAACDSRAVLDAYLTPPRLDVLTELMGVKNGWAILVFKEDKMLLRFDTPEPLDREKKLEILVKKMIKAAKVLELEQGEFDRLKAERAKQPPKQAAVKIDDTALDSSGLELEEDEDEDQPENPPTENS